MRIAGHQITGHLAVVIYQGLTVVVPVNRHRQAIADTQTIREYNGKTGGRPESYVITVRVRGRGLSGEAFSITANSISEFRGSCAEEEEEAPA